MLKSARARQMWEEQGSLLLTNYEIGPDAF